MQEVLGRHNEDDAFLAYLATWREILKARVDEATDRIARIRGVRGLILAGSNGLGQPWPLSDIDLIPIYADEYADTAIRSVESLREAILDEWSTQGWRTGLDIGRLHFRAGELEAAFRKGNPEPVLLLADDRWYHAIDKAYGGRAVLDRDGQATHLAAWFSANRFQPDVVVFRMGRSAAHARTPAGAVRGHLDDDLVTA